MGYTIRDHLQASTPEEYQPQSTPHEQHSSKIEGCD